MSTNNLFKNDSDPSGVSGALRSALAAQDMADRLVRDALPVVNIAHELAPSLKITYPPIALIAQHEAMFKGLEVQLPPLFTPQLGIANLVNGITEAQKAVSFVQGFQSEWLSNITSALSLYGDLTFNHIGEGITKQWVKTWANLDFGATQRRLLVPSNWPDEFEEYLPTIQDILNNEGLPLAWVPRQSILLELLHAESAESRLNILREHRDDVLEDCGDILLAMEDEFLAGQIPLARDVIAACRDGHWTAGAALAVMITHGIVERLDWTTNPKSVKARYRFTMNLTLNNMITGVTQASLVSFYEEWHPKSDKPEPKFLARHMVSHHVSDSHLNDHNSMVAVMLMASLMETVYQLDLGQRRDAAA